MSQRRKRSLSELKRTWASENEPTKPNNRQREVNTPSHTKKVAPAHREVRPALPKVPEQPKPSRPKTRPAPKRIYLNTVLTPELEHRLERAVKFHQRQEGKAFGRSAYGRRALIAQLERDGF